MRTHIDWLTFTMTMRYSDDGVLAYATAIENAFSDLFSVATRSKAFGYQWEVLERSRAPYTDAWAILDGGVTLFASPTLTHCCVEISGQGCERMIERDVLNEVLTAVADRVTRIDIACDIETTVRPSEFVSQMKHERMRASGFQTSDTGETYYCGSQKSDRYARVYRYFAPHPREHLLRIEHVFRREYAKKTAHACVDYGTGDVAQAAGEAFGWSHSIWQPSMDQSVDLSIVQAERKMGKTVFWLVKSVAPAFKRLVREGVITDPEQFFEKYFTDNVL